MGRFLPLLPPVPNLAILASRRGGQLQTRENIRRDYLVQVESLFNELLAEQIDPVDRERIWQKAAEGLDQAFAQFNLDGLSLKTAPSRQLRFKRAADEALKALLLESLSAVDSEQLVTALNSYVNKEQEKWRQHIGPEEYQSFQRLLLIDAIDREWRDYLTAMDDLRREIGLAAIGQRDPKVEYKRRSFEMFADMRNNINRDIVNRFFGQVAGHQAFIQQQEAAVAYQLQAQDAGYQVVRRAEGKGTELRRDMPKVGRNDPCPCGSGKKYKQCHGRQGRTSTSGGRNGRKEPANQASGRNKAASKKRRRR